MEPQFTPDNDFSPDGLLPEIQTDLALSFADISKSLDLRLETEPDGFERQIFDFNGVEIGFYSPCELRGDVDVWGDPNKGWGLLRSEKFEEAQKVRALGGVSIHRFESTNAGIRINSLNGMLDTPNTVNRLYVEGGVESVLNAASWLEGGNLDFINAAVSVKSREDNPLRDQVIDSIIALRLYAADDQVLGDETYAAMDPRDFRAEAIVLKSLLGDQSAIDLVTKARGVLEQHQIARKAKVETQVAEQLSQLSHDEKGREIEPFPFDKVVLVRSMSRPPGEDTEGMYLQNSATMFRGTQYRSTVHFSLNHAVEGHAYGTWDNADFTVIAGLEDTMNINGVTPHAVNTVDTAFVLEENERLHLPANAVLVRAGNNFKEGEILHTAGNEVSVRKLDFGETELLKLVGVLFAENPAQLLEVKHKLISGIRNQQANLNIDDDNLVEVENQLTDLLELDDNDAEKLVNAWTNLSSTLLGIIGNDVVKDFEEQIHGVSDSVAYAVLKSYAVRDVLRRTGKPIFQANQMGLSRVISNNNAEEINNTSISDEQRLALCFLRRGLLYGGLHSESPEHKLDEDFKTLENGNITPRKLYYDRGNLESVDVKSLRALYSAGLL